MSTFSLTYRHLEFAGRCASARWILNCKPSSCQLDHRFYTCSKVVLEKLPILVLLFNILIYPPLIMNHTSQRQACDRCHGQKLACKRENDNVSCSRCVRAKVKCVSRPSLRSKRARQRAASTISRNDDDPMSPTVGETGSQTVQGQQTLLDSDWTNSNVKRGGQSSHLCLLK